MQGNRLTSRAAAAAAAARKPALCCSGLLRIAIVFTTLVRETGCAAAGLRLEPAKAGRAVKDAMSAAWTEVNAFSGQILVENKLLLL
jgi:hypothetical protein